MGEEENATVSALRDQVARLQQLNEELGQENASLGQQNASLGRQNVSLGQERSDLLQQLKEEVNKNGRLQEKVDQLNRRHFGKSSEKIHPDQLGLFPEEEGDAPSAPVDLAPDDESASASPKRKRRRTPREPMFPEDIPTEEIVHDLPEEEKSCEQCQCALEEIGRESSDQIDLIPASFLRIRHVRIKYACKECEENVKRAPAPVRPLAKALPAAGLLAWILVSKYKDHLPLNRISQIFQRWGARISRSTLCDWVMGCSELLASVVARMKEEVLASDYVGTDDTGVLVQVPMQGKRNKNKTQKAQAYLWPYRAGDQVVYDFTLSRARDGPEKYLDGFKGHLQTDDYVVYHRLQRRPDVTGVGCWAHVRRRFVEAFPGDLERTGPVLACIQILYRMEREFKAEGLSTQQRQAERRTRSRPVLADLLRLVRPLDRDQCVAPKSLLGKAIGYLLRNRKNLVEFTKHGKLEIDNNGVEQCVRPIALGRKNWLFAGSPRGGTAAANLYSLIETCRLQDIEPLAYLKDLLGRLPTASEDEIACLTPRAWKAAQKAEPISAEPVTVD
jgi:transposase